MVQSSGHLEGAATDAVDAPVIQGIYSERCRECNEASQIDGDIKIHTDSHCVSEH